MISSDVELQKTNQTNVEENIALSLKQCQVLTVCIFETLNTP